MWGIVKIDKDKNKDQKSNGAGEDNQKLIKEFQDDWMTLNDEQLRYRLGLRNSVADRKVLIRFSNAPQLLHFKLPSGKLDLFKQDFGNWTDKIVPVESKAEASLMSKLFSSTPEAVMVEITIPKFVESVLDIIECEYDNAKYKKTRPAGCTPYKELRSTKFHPPYQQLAAALIFVTHEFAEKIRQESKGFETTDHPLKHCIKHLLKIFEEKQILNALLETPVVQGEKSVTTWASELKKANLLLLVEVARKEIKEEQEQRARFLEAQQANELEEKQKAAAEAEAKRKEGEQKKGGQKPGVAKKPSGSAARPGHGRQPSAVPSRSSKSKPAASPKHLSSDAKSSVSRHGRQSSVSRSISTSAVVVDLGHNRRSSNVPARFALQPKATGSAKKPDAAAAAQNVG